MTVEVDLQGLGGAAQALVRGWDEAVDGPRPTVWSPASSSWAPLVQQLLADEDNPMSIPDEREPSPRPRSCWRCPGPWPRRWVGPTSRSAGRDLAALAKSPDGWGAEGHPEWGRFKLGKTNPYFSTSGLNATIASLLRGHGPVERPERPRRQGAEDPKAFVKRIESSVVHYGDTTLTFLANMAREAEKGQGLTYVSAVTVEEKSVLRLQPGQPHRRPGHRRPAARPRGAAGGGLPQRRHSGVGQPLVRPRRVLGQR